MWLINKRIDMEYKKYIKFGILILFIVYIIGVLYVVFLKHRFVLGSLNYEAPFSFYWENNVNLVPFKTIKDYMVYENNLSDNIKYINILGNVALFIPFGVIFPVLLSGKLKFLKTIGSAFLFSLLIEVLQMTFRIGSFDVDDIILNVFGGFIGYFICIIILKFKNIINY